MNEQAKTFYAVWWNSGNGTSSNEYILFPSVAEAEKHYQVRVNPVTLESDERDERYRPLHSFEEIEVPEWLAIYIQGMYEAIMKHEGLQR